MKSSSLGLAPRVSGMEVLSIGCISEPLNVGLGRRFTFGLGYWGLKIVNVFMTAQSSSSLGTAQVLAGHENVFRINLPVPKGRFGWMLSKKFHRLEV
jgi:hypothetical protein